MLVITGIRNWYCEVNLSIDLIDNFVRSTEKQVAESIESFRAARADGTLDVYVGNHNSDVETDDSFEPARIVEVHRGFDSETWNLNELFEKYFPNLQRRSALLTLWSFFEYELHKLCLLYQREDALKLSVVDLSGKGIDKAVNYLEKIVGLEGLRQTNHWQQLKDLQEIRNAVAHNDGRLKGRDGIPKKTVLDAMKRVGYVKGDDELHFEQEFLFNALTICRNYFKVIGTAIKKKG